ncbi:probable tRNA splicing endonuclease subunit Sen2 [Cyanidioschyzon merolae strain 10D]|jgi:tRNA-intron lyase|uniref:tRNA-intron lyase n=1 Tax=Cyanidioschyzon merolae (strain NIES-3377 / 10D) TaxID=280699 RepID=M1VJ94_CYAM1|nr:probable tRNA splicing endonuclease subunit Sen2 [Cyanidioschyzon merolae strain 10D]BAM81323.1 probable tRNA splicing endonuclease subunit Sen2 [Cyanidioschyzon merolae strain 10D]|eukprot:XP_005537359.1 probable tRNA splicing endonuclease subunit Sen2 [Cyanidioschyzon merolae strain 10D]
MSVQAQLVGGEFWVTDPVSARLCWQSLMGFGKGNLSRSRPVYGELVRGAVDHVHLGRALRSLVRAGHFAARTDKEDVEHLHLAPFEAAYLAFDEQFLTVKGFENTQSLWTYFVSLPKEHLRQYAVYRAYRHAGWAPHSGCKYGADFVLYRFRASEGRHSHAPYAVLVRSANERIHQRWIAVQNQLRLTKQVAKRLVYVEVSMSTAMEHLQHRERWLQTVCLHEVLVDRWTPSIRTRSKEAKQRAAK